MQIVGETITGSVDYALSHYKEILFVLLISLSLFAFVFGLAGYQANCIQLGLDQLFEAPSQYLGLFIHYAMWVFQSGTLSFITLFSPMLCSHLPNKTIALMFTILYVIVMTLLLLISYWKHQWFHNEPGHQNPYRTVCGILKFAKSHKYPLQRSAFTYSESYIFLLGWTLPRRDLEDLSLQSRLKMFKDTTHSVCSWTGGCFRSSIIVFCFPIFPSLLAS